MTARSAQTVKKL